MTQDHEYYQRRELQERDRAASSADSTARRVHLELAERYSAMTRDIPPAASRQFSA